MTAGYDFHPEAEIDLDAIWEFIAEDSQIAADRMIDAIEATHRSACSISLSRSPPPRFDLASVALHQCGKLPHCLCARQKAAVGCRGHARTPKPSRDGCNAERKRVTPAEFLCGAERRPNFFITHWLNASDLMEEFCRVLRWTNPEFSRRVIAQLRAYSV